MTASTGVHGEAALQEPLIPAFPDAVQPRDWNPLSPLLLARDAPLGKV